MLICVTIASQDYLTLYPNSNIAGISGVNNAHIYRQKAFASCHIQLHGLLL